MNTFVIIINVEWPEMGCFLISLPLLSLFNWGGHGIFTTYIPTYTAKGRQLPAFETKEPGEKTRREREGKKVENWGRRKKRRENGEKLSDLQDDTLGSLALGILQQGQAIKDKSVEPFFMLAGSSLCYVRIDMIP